MSFWGANITNHSPYLKSQNQNQRSFFFLSLRAPKMLSMAVQPGISGGVFTQTSFPSKTLTFKPFKSFIKPKLSSFHSYKSLETPNNTRRREVILSAASATSVVEEEEEEEDIEDGLLTVIDEKGVEVKENKVEVKAAKPAKPPSPYENDEDSEMLGVFVNPFEKPRLVLRFVWMEKNIGLGLDQLIPGQGTVPLSPYYFWPRKDAWEELKTVIESKPWISHKKKIILLNHATDVIDLWQQSGGNLSGK